jgi:hypothetical protein
VDGWLSLRMHGIVDVPKSATAEDFDDLAFRSKKEVFISLTTTAGQRLPFELGHQSRMSLSIWESTLA